MSWWGFELQSRGTNHPANDPPSPLHCCPCSMGGGPFLTNNYFLDIRYLGGCRGHRGPTDTHSSPLQSEDFELMIISYHGWPSRTMAGHPESGLLGIFWCSCFIVFIRVLINNHKKSNTGPFIYMKSFFCFFSFTFSKVFCPSMHVPYTLIVHHQATLDLLYFISLRSGGSTAYTGRHRPSSAHLLSLGVFHTQIFFPVV